MSAILEPRVTFSESVLSILAAIAGDEVDLTFQLCAACRTQLQRFLIISDRDLFVPALTVSIA